MWLLTSLSLPTGSRQKRLFHLVLSLGLNSLTEIGKWDMNNISAFFVLVSIRLAHFNRVHFRMLSGGRIGK